MKFLESRRTLILVLIAVLLIAGASVGHFSRSLAAATPFLGSAVLLTGLLPGTSLLLRIFALFVALVILGAGGWLDLNIWDFERAKPNPHYLGPPKY